MASSLSAITTGGGGLVALADASGNLNLVSDTTTIVAMTSAGIAVTGTLSASGAFNDAATVIVASATSTAIGGAASINVDISGTTTITSFDTVAEGINRKGRFTGALTLTHNATSLILPGAASITTAANDRYEARSLGSGNWIVTKYQPASVSIFHGSFSRDVSLASGTQAVTGVGFTPKAVIFLANINVIAATSIGFISSATNSVLFNRYLQTSGTNWANNGINAITLVTGPGVQYDGALSSLGSDGFTISWSRAGSPTGTADIRYLAFR